MDEKLFTLEEVLNEDGIFFVDNSIGCFGNSFLWDSYYVKSYSELNLDQLIELRETFLGFQDILANDKCFTIQAVVDEIADFSDIIGGKVKWLNDRLNKNHKANKAVNRHYFNRSIKARENFQSFHDLIWDTKQLADKSKISFNDEFYNSLVEIYKAFTTAIPSLKKNNSYQIYGKLRKKKFLREKINENDTDERLAAAVIYETLFHDKPVSLLTSHRDFISLLLVVPIFLGSDSFLPRNKEFRTKLVSNPYSLYLLNPDHWEKRYDSSDFLDRYGKEFKIYDINESQSENFKEVVDLFWKKFDVGKVHSETN